MTDLLKLPADITPPQIKTGMTIRIHQKIKETDPSGKEKERIQMFEGLVIKVGGAGVSKTMTVRKIGANNIGVERIYPLTLPSIAKIELVKMAKVNRQVISYVRHSKKKMKEVQLTELPKA